jgi:hypothetical protein
MQAHAAYGRPARLRRFRQYHNSEVSPMALIHVIKVLCIVPDSYPAQHLGSFDGNSSCFASLCFLSAFPPPTRDQDLVSDSNIYLTTAAAVSAARAHLLQLDEADAPDPAAGTPAPGPADLGGLHLIETPPGRGSMDALRLPLFSLSESTGYGILAAEGMLFGY